MHINNEIDDLSQKFNVSSLIKPGNQRFSASRSKQSTNQKRSTKCSMSDHYTQAQGDFTSGEEQNLFKTSSLTVQRHQQFTEPDSSKQFSSEFSTFKS